MRILFLTHKDKAKLLSWLLVSNDSCLVFLPFTSFYVIMGQGFQENMAAPQQYLNERQKLSMAKTLSHCMPMGQTILEVYFQIMPFVSLFFVVKMFNFELGFNLSSVSFPGLNKHWRISQNVDLFLFHFPATC